jgi:hypothetical protein
MHRIISFKCLNCQESVRWKSPNIWKWYLNQCYTYMLNKFLQLEMLNNIGQVQFTKFFTFLLVFQSSNQNCWHFYHPKCLFEYDPNKKLLSFEYLAHLCFSCKNKDGTPTRTRTGKEVRRNMSRSCTLGTTARWLRSKMSEYDRVLSSGKGLGNQEPHAWYGPTTLGWRGGTTNLKRTRPRSHPH